MSVALLSHTPEHLRLLFDGGAGYEAQTGIALAEGAAEFFGGPDVSESFEARVRVADKTDPWRDGFGVLHVDENRVIGLATFNGPPDRDAAVEISYAIAPDYVGRGYATAAARLLIAYAKESGHVNSVRARTLPEENASSRILRKCGFQMKGEITDPEDGLIWQWELRLRS